MEELKKRVLNKKVKNRGDYYLYKYGALLGIIIIIISSFCLQEKTVYKSSISPYILILIGIIGSFAFSRFVYDKIAVNSQINVLWFIIILFAIQVFLCLNISFRTTWDPRAVMYSAYFAAIGEAEGMRNMAEYLSIYPNNLLIVWIYSIFYFWNECVFHFTGDTLILLQVFQCVLSSLTALFVYLCEKKLGYSEKTARLAMLFYILLTGLSAWLVIPYTDSTGILLPVLIFYLTILSNDATGVKLYSFMFLLGFVGYFSYKIKPEIVIVLIAYICVNLVEWIRKKEYKRLVFMACGIITCMVLVNIAIESMHYELDKEAEMGWQHFIMQGVNEKSNGSNSDSDLELSKSFKTKAERDAFNLKTAKERVEEMGLQGYARLLCVKIYVPFTSGTFGWGGVGKSFYDETYYPKFGRVTKFLRSVFWEKEAIDSRVSLYGVYAFLKQLLWNTLIGGMFLSILLRRSINKNEAVLYLTMIGVFVYFMLLESHPRYMFVISSFVIIIAVSGLERRKMNSES